MHVMFYRAYGSNNPWRTALGLRKDGNGVYRWEDGTAGELFQDIIFISVIIFSGSFST